MLKFKTIDKIDISSTDAYGNVIVVNEYLRIIVSEVKFDTNNAYVFGYYYFIDINGNLLILRPFSNKPFLISDLKLLEPSLPPLSNSLSFFDHLEQRVYDFTKIILQSEEPNEFGFVFSDLEIEIN